MSLSYIPDPEYFSGNAPEKSSSAIIALILIALGYYVDLFVSQA